MARITNLETNLKNDSVVKRKLINQLENAKIIINKEAKEDSYIYNEAIDSAMDVINILAKRYK
ncbi:EscE/YscE/SsaE family type III secretion system needle protein co-chaperone [Vibrio hepatarius]|uniref:EscE/YscE/SsaE family type III secretion system needle protein co-chaperone n=1 Tax=Vibrio hepatarius TaxID=171383 RepID=UPI001C0955BE|nr:EscE/YscE/SsaE family type III secretion system needle protein co-chaperone [Vibrio hepatarius]MBU2898924.1 EscE/YscE/SsaE family type III secretion system needle protein co-chaperone [Vibrio hepatarius]